MRQVQGLNICNRTYTKTKLEIMAILVQKNFIVDQYQVKYIKVLS